MDIRIIGGIARGRKLKSPSSFSTRPLLGRVKKSLFDILSPYIKDSYFLDLYGGVGSVGVEALSRGARKAVFVENDSDCISLIKENLAKCGFEDKAEIYQGDVLGGLAFLLSEEKFDLVFVGPPYNLNLLEKTIKIIDETKILKGKGLVIGQHHFKEVIPQKIGNLGMFRQKKYGDMRLSFFKIGGKLE
ncbi:16S rRNA (guanine(966)-N(2))-methyltransferase RsmD [bacterium]|nr:16S rRNA (guanine(966)-N(2))-methyltransferase RsmD [bacterium]